MHRVASFRKWGAFAAVLALSCYAATWHLVVNNSQEPKAVAETSNRTTRQNETRSPNAVQLDEVLITIRTCQAFHHSRLDVVLDTWFKKARKQVYVITDVADPEFQNKTGNRLVASNCGRSHGVRDLCCKVGVAYDLFMADETKHWWCAYDDDCYLNVDRLLELFSKFDRNEPTYLGRRSRPSRKMTYNGKAYEHQYGTGGTGICVNRPLAELMRPYYGKTTFPEWCMKLRSPEDCATGFIVTKLLGVELSESFLLHAHNERLKDLPAETLHEQVSFSYKGKNRLNLTSINPKFNTTVDPTRFMSLHCHLYPNDVLCKTSPLNDSASEGQDLVNKTSDFPYMKPLVRLFERLQNLVSGVN